ncbi:cytochrome P450 [Hyaloraphidium curvatum]|nr:cytochrome P450 [Hyaloraphidium curvatum]
MELASLPPLLLAVLAAALAALWFVRTRPGQSRLPPGPRPESWLRGNRLPPTMPWLQFEKWTREFGDVFSVRFGRTRLFVLGRAPSAHEVLEKRAAASADRPRLIMAGELISDNKRMLILPHGDRWRLFRKVVHEFLSEKASKMYEPIQEREARIAMLNLGRSEPTKGAFQAIFKRYAASTIMQVTYDYEITSLADPLLKAVEERLTAMATWIRPGQSTLDNWPVLMYLPTFMNPWKKEGLRLRALEQKLFLGEFLKVRERVGEGKCNPCFVSAIQAKQSELGFTDLECSYIAGSMFGAGSDTTASALAIFVLACLHHPDVLKKMQAEVDAVCGSHRLPTFAEAPSMPYVNASVKETLRWRPVSAGGFQHRLTEDVDYGGYLLPAGSTVVGPHWSISLDETEYPDPHAFKPERFLPANQPVWFAPRVGSVAFGFGRRICPGLHVAMRSLFINLACMAWCFDILPAGPDPVDTFAFTSAANSHPLPFAAVFRFRDDRRREVLEAECRGTGELERIREREAGG